jgi:hypothetical protein
VTEAASSQKGNGPEGGLDLLPSGDIDEILAGVDRTAGAAPSFRHPFSPCSFAAASPNKPAAIGLEPSGSGAKAPAPVA